MKSSCYVFFKHHLTLSIGLEGLAIVVGAFYKTFVLELINPAPCSVTVLIFFQFLFILYKIFHVLNQVIKIHFAMFALYLQLVEMVV